mgnify:CR=1 FL=1
MAFKKIARKSSDFKVVFTVRDFCWPPPPAPPSVPPILFPLFVDLGGAKTVAKDVRLNASLLLSLKPVRRTKLMVTKSPDQVARTYFPALPQNPVFPAKPPLLVWSRNYYPDQEPIWSLGGFNLCQLASNTH